MATTPPSTANDQQSSARRDFRDKPDLAEDVDRVVGLVQPKRETALRSDKESYEE